MPPVQPRSPLLPANRTAPSNPTQVWLAQKRDKNASTRTTSLGHGDSDATTRNSRAATNEQQEWLLRQKGSTVPAGARHGYIRDGVPSPAKSPDPTQPLGDKAKLSAHEYGGELNEAFLKYVSDALKTSPGALTSSLRPSDKWSPAQKAYIEGRLDAGRASRVQAPATFAGVSAELRQLAARGPGAFNTHRFATVVKMTADLAGDVRGPEGDTRKTEAKALLSAIRNAVDDGNVAVEDMNSEEFIEFQHAILKLGAATPREAAAVASKLQAHHTNPATRLKAQQDTAPIGAGARAGLRATCEALNMLVAAKDGNIPSLDEFVTGLMKAADHVSTLRALDVNPDRWQQDANALRFLISDKLLTGTNRLEDLNPAQYATLQHAIRKIEAGNPVAAQSLVKKLDSQRNIRMALMSRLGGLSDTFRSVARAVYAALGGESPVLPQGSSANLYHALKLLLDTQKSLQGSKLWSALPSAYEKFNNYDAAKDVFLRDKGISVGGFVSQFATRLEALIVGAIKEGAKGSEVACQGTLNEFVTVVDRNEGYVRFASAMLRQVAIKSGERTAVGKDANKLADAFDAVLNELVGSSYLRNATAVVARTAEDRELLGSITAERDRARA